MNLPHAHCEGLDVLVPSLPLALRVFLLPLLWVSLSDEGRNLRGKFHLGVCVTSIHQSLPNEWLWVSMFLSAVVGSCFDDIDMLIQEYSRRSLIIITLILFGFT